MSVVAWDGKVLAADSMTTNNDMGYTTSKMHRGDDAVFAFCGETDGMLMLLEWYAKGAQTEEWPLAIQCIGDHDFRTRMVVADRRGLHFYERLPYPQWVLDPYMAFGSGRDYAMGAMAMGANAVQAVEAAIKHCQTCGGPVESYEVPR